MAEAYDQAIVQMQRNILQPQQGPSNIQTRHGKLTSSHNVLPLLGPRKLLPCFTTLPEGRNLISAAGMEHQVKGKPVASDSTQAANIAAIPESKG